jgi:hypothetical protein
MLRMLPVFLCVCAIGCTTNAQTKTPAPMQSSNMDVGQYSTAAEAKPLCGSGQVAWEDPDTGILYPPTDKYSGSIKDGAYMCKSFALKNGMVMVR